MWTIIKLNPKKFELLKKDFLKKLGSETFFYRPKVEFYKKDKKKITYFLSDYVICFNKFFSDKEKINLLKYSIGLKYFLKGHQNNQNEIEKFVDFCKQNENINGSLTLDFFNININSKFKFLNGPFRDLIFNILENNKRKLKVLIGNIEANISKKNLFIKPV